jgi:hypothetical protein
MRVKFQPKRRAPFQISSLLTSGENVPLRPFAADECVFPVSRLRTRSPVSPSKTATRRPSGDQTGSVANLRIVVEQQPCFNGIHVHDPDPTRIVLAGVKLLALVKNLRAIRVPGGIGADGPDAACQRARFAAVQVQLPEIDGAFRAVLGISDLFSVRADGEIFDACLGPGQRLSLIAIQTGQIQTARGGISGREENAESAPDQASGA